MSLSTSDPEIALMFEEVHVVDQIAKEVRPVAYSGQRAAGSAQRCS